MNAAERAAWVQKRCGLLVAMLVVAQQEQDTDWEARIVRELNVLNPEKNK